MIVNNKRKKEQQSVCAVCAVCASGVPSPAVQRVIDRYREVRHTAQKSKEWKLQRLYRVTGSDCPAMLGNNYFKSYWEVVENKATDALDLLGLPRNEKIVPFDGNEATAWGEKYEDEAVEVYMSRTGHHVLTEFGMMPHPRCPEVMGASPDGLTLCGIMLEIKCPYTADIPKNPKSVPKHYLDQVQCLLACFEIDRAHFIRYRPPGFVVDAVGRDEKTGRKIKKPVERKGVPAVFNYVEVSREPDWDEHALQHCRQLLADMQRAVEQHPPKPRRLST